MLLEQSGEVEKAGKAYVNATRIRSDGATLIRDALLLPVIPESRGQIEDYRARMEEKLEQLKDQSLRIDDPVYEVGATNFMLAYHGMNDQTLQTKVADLYRRVAPSLTFEAPHCRGWLAGMAGGFLRVGCFLIFHRAYGGPVNGRGDNGRVPTSRRGDRLYRRFCERPANSPAWTVRLKDRAVAPPTGGSPANDCGR